MTQNHLAARAKRARSPSAGPFRTSPPLRERGRGARRPSPTRGPERHKRGRLLLRLAAFLFSEAVAGASEGRAAPAAGGAEAAPAAPTASTMTSCLNANSAALSGAPPSAPSAAASNSLAPSALSWRNSQSRLVTAERLVREKRATDPAG